MENDDAAKILAENASLLFGHADEILGDPRFFHCPFGDLSLAYVGAPACCLGALLECWAQGKLVVRCPRCKDRVLIFALGGSPLSGTHSWVGVCTGCGATIRSNSGGWSEERPVFRDLWQPLRGVLGSHPNGAVVEKGERPHFDWGAGIVGKRTPDRVIRPRVEPVPFAQIVDILRGGKGRVQIRDSGGAPVFDFEWSLGTLRSATGAELRIVGRQILDASGTAILEWDGLYLRGSDGAVLCELARTTLGPLRMGRVPIISSIVPLRFGARGAVRLWLGPFDGSPRWELCEDAIATAKGELLYTHEGRIARAAAALLALGLGPA